jgi:hypothetical protein
MKHAFLLLCVIGISLAALGCCGPAKDRTYDVKGTVNVDKTPLKDGQITLDDSTGGVPASMKIINGNYEGKARAGTHKVAIQAFKEGEKAEGPGAGKDERQRVNYLPERFHTKSELPKAEVTAAGSNKFDYEVESK